MGNGPAGQAHVGAFAGDRLPGAPIILQIGIPENLVELRRSELGRLGTIDDVVSRAGEAVDVRLEKPERMRGLGVRNLHRSFHRASAAFFAIRARSSGVRFAARAFAPAWPLRVLPDFLSSGSSPVAIFITITAAPITSPGRFSPFGPLGKQASYCLADHTANVFAGRGQHLTNRLEHGTCQRPGRSGIDPHRWRNSRNFFHSTDPLRWAFRPSAPSGAVVIRFRKLTQCPPGPSGLYLGRCRCERAATITPNNGSAAPSRAIAS